MSRPLSVSQNAESALHADRMESLNRLQTIMDSAIGLPGGFRVGLDPLLGLIPVVGDIAAAGVSLYIVYAARRMGVSSSAQRRMLRRILVDVAVGSIPIAGDIFDAFYRVNERNMQTLEARARSGRLMPPA